MRFTISDMFQCATEILVTQSLNQKKYLLSPLFTMCYVYLKVFVCDLNYFISICLKSAKRFRVSEEDWWPISDATKTNPMNYTSLLHAAACNVIVWREQFTIYLTFKVSSGISFKVFIYLWNKLHSLSRMHFWINYKL